jgi:hypothetical protein
MDRSEFLRASLGLLGAGLAGSAGAAQLPDCEAVERERQFTANWLADLLDAMDAQLDQPTRERLIAACGRACYLRHAFKQDIAAAGRDSVDALITAYAANFEVWRAEDGVHVRYGKVSRGCYCPAAKARPPRPGDLHCECTRATHRMIFETALGRPVEVDVLESVRRGGRTCHFLARV